MLLFDIGANIGKWALANQAGNTIVCVEACRSTFNNLVSSTAKYPNIKCLHYAVSPSIGSVEFFESDLHTLNTLDRTWLSSVTSRFYDPSRAIWSSRVDTISIDTLIKQYGVPDVLKIDVEGAENIVLRSLTQKAGTLCFEWASEWRTQTRECIRYAESLGYTRFYLQFGDAYTFRPSEFNHTCQSLLDTFDRTNDKIDWGMIWCS
jgi:FkbM family methyltransferase